MYFVVHGCYRPHLSTPGRFCHSLHPTTAGQTPRKFCCKSQIQVCGSSAAYVPGEEDRRRMNGASLGILAKIFTLTQFITR